MGVEGGHADVLPPLYARWASEFLGGAIPAESAATCNDCAMLSGERGTARPAAAPFFNPDTKCCTYLPVLPNFLVGRMLADDSPEFARGRATLEARLTAGMAVSPRGIGRDAAYDLLYVTRGKSLFGQARSMRCPHYLDEGGGQCGIWRHRAAVCATWFCKYVRGAVGQRFWQALHRQLSAVEGELSVWCARQLGELGEWSGREREFFQECAPAGRGASLARRGADLRTRLERLREQVLQVPADGFVDVGHCPATEAEAAAGIFFRPAGGLNNAI